MSRFRLGLVASLVLLGSCGGETTSPREPLIQPVLALHLPAGLAVGDTADATLTATNADGFQADLTFAPAALHFLGAAGESGDVVAINADSAGEGQLRVLAVRPTGGTPTLHLAFEVMGPYDSSAITAVATAVIAPSALTAEQVGAGPRPSAVVPSLFGDLTGNGVVDLLDVFQAARAAVGLQITGVAGEPLLSAVANVYPENAPGIGGTGDATPPGRDPDGVFRFNLLDVFALARAAVGLPSTVVRQVVPAPQITRYTQLGPAAIVVSVPTSPVPPNGRQSLSASCRGLTNQPVACPALSWTVSGGAFAPAAGTDTIGSYLAAGSVGIFPVKVTGGGKSGAAAVTIAGSVNLMLNGSQRFQTWEGWEHSSTNAADPPYSYSDALADSVVRYAVTELGQNRIRLEAAWNNIETDGTPSGVPDSPYLWKNDNASAMVANPLGFRWTEFDTVVRKWVLPLRKYAGAQFRLNLCIVAMRLSPAAVATDSAEYAEFGLIVVQHLRNSFGLTPDQIELMLEPRIAGVELGRDLAALRARLAGAGLGAVGIIGPSLVDPNPTVAYGQALAAVAGSGRVTEISYHRYTRPGSGNLQSIAGYASGIGARTSMLEHIGADPSELYDDLTLANVSAWQRYILAGPPTPAGLPEGKLVYVTPATGKIVLAPSTYGLRQYMKYIHTGDVRIGVTSGDATIRPVAFRRPDGTVLVVANTTAAATLVISGLPAGSYQTTYSTATQPGVSGAVQTIAAGGVLPAAIPAAGVISLVPVP